MTILSHRGYWKALDERNTPLAFRRSFTLGFGTETDLRDAGGRLVISHDPPGTDALSFEEFLTLYTDHGPGLPLALNVKADGLQALAKEALERFGVTEYFFFDMSVPDALGYLKNGLTTFTRLSEYESAPSYLYEAAGVWADMFLSDWIQERDITDYLAAGKRVCLVSPDLHKRPHSAFWERVKGWGSVHSPALMLCTDLPEEAREFFL
jgi:hypothetical protein